MRGTADVSSAAMTRREWLAAWAAWGCGLGVAWPSAAWAAPTGQAALESGQAADPTTWSIAELEAALTRGAATPLEVVAAYVARIAEVDPSLGAFVTVSRDRALDETRRLMRAATATGRRGPLFGVPIAHKDLLATRGVRTTGGSLLHADWIPETDADLVARCTRAGAVLLGKTNTHELGGGVTTINPFYGTTKHPHDPARIPGGSSGGSATAVAARLALVATGSDTGGSVRIPAALCGCVGFKPTFGVLPVTGVLGASPSFDHVGLLARSVDDAARFFAAVSSPGDDAAAAHLLTRVEAAANAGLRGVRVGVPRTYFFERLDRDVEIAVEAALTHATRAGAVLRDVSLGLEATSYDTMFAPTVVHEIRATYQRDWRRRPEAFSKDFAAVFEGPAPSDRDLARALAARDAHARDLARVFSRVDVLAMPSVPMVAPRIVGPIDGMRILRHTWPSNAAGTPAISVPCGRGAANLPVGLQLVAPKHADVRLLGVAAAWERLSTR